MDSVKEGGFSGAAVGLTVASVRMFLFGRETAIKEMAKQASAEKAAAIVAAQKGGAITSTAAKAPILRPNVSSPVFYMRHTSFHRQIPIITKKSHYLTIRISMNISFIYT